MHIRVHRGLLPLALAIAGALLAAFAMTFADDNRAGALTNCTVTHDANDSEELAFLGLINNYRAQNGLGALTISSNLNRGSAWMVEDMATNNYFSHTDSLGRSPYQRAIDCGYPSGAGENLAAGTNWSTAQTAFDAWKASSGHNANMLGQYYRQIGIARFNAPGSTYGWYWATTFGTVDDGSGGGGGGTGSGGGGTGEPPTNTPFPPTSTPLPTRTPTPVQPTATPVLPTATPVQPTATPTTTQSGAGSPGGATATPTPKPSNTTAPPPPPSSGSPSTPTKTPVTPSATPTKTPTLAAAKTATPTATPKQGSVSLALSAGANFIAWPGESVSPAQVFAGNTSVKVVYEWNSTTGEWRRFFPGMPAYLNNLSKLYKGGVYWFVADRASQLQVAD